MRRIPALVVAFSLVSLVGLLAVAQETSQAPAAPSGPPPPVVETMKIVVDNKAKNDGEIRLTFTPAGGAAKEIRVTVAKGMSAKEICRDIAKELKVAAGADYEIDHYDPDKIKIEGKKGAKFSMTLAGQTVKGTTIELK